jgi:hypothetical protein
MSKIVKYFSREHLLQMSRVIQHFNANQDLVAADSDESVHAALHTNALAVFNTINDEDKINFLVGAYMLYRQATELTQQNMDDLIAFENFQTKRTLLLRFSSFILVILAISFGSALWHVFTSGNAVSYQDSSNLFVEVFKAILGIGAP